MKAGRETYTYVAIMKWNYLCALLRDAFVKSDIPF